MLLPDLHIGFSGNRLSIGNLILGSSAFSKPSLYIWKFSIHILLKPSLKDFEHNLASMWWKWKLLHHVWLFVTPWVHGILQARILEWVAVPFSRGSSQPRDRTQVSHIAGGFYTSWVTREAQEYWSGLPFPPPRDLPNPGIEPTSLALAGRFFAIEPPWKPRKHYYEQR